jgi:signal transduction histidine kinase
MKRALSFRSRLLLVVLPSLLVLAALGLAVTLPRVGAARVATKAAANGKVAESAMLLFDEVQQESTLSSRYLRTKAEAARAELTLQRAKTDARRVTFRALISPLTTVAVDGVNGLSKPGASAANDIDPLRGGVDNVTISPDESFASFARVQRSLVLLAGALTRTAGNKSLIELGSLIGSYLEAKELKGLVYTYPAGRLDGTQWTQTEVATFIGLQGNADRALATFKATADIDTLRAYSSLASKPEVTETDQLAKDFVAAARQNIAISLASDAWVQRATKALDAVNSLDDNQFVQYNRKASDLASSERRSALLYGLLGAAGLLSAALAAFFVGRSLTSRLRKVTTDAHNIAVDQLPQVLETLRHPTPEALAGALPQLTSDKNDEIGQLAADFNTILRTSIETSLEHSQRQATTMTNLLLNLGRRNQSLIDRQLELIDHMESSEQDPDLLEGLFKLDHMVTRQRRNAESLLILAGSNRSRSWSASVPLSDVIRGASSEVADLNRVRFEAQPGNDLLLSGQYAVDLSHLLAELIENATLYSNPNTSVTVRMQRGPSHFRVWVIDSGVGMTEDELLAANQVVKSPPLIEDIATDRVGFQVVGRLAQRFGARVRLQNNPAGGVAASIDLPFSLFDVLHQDAPVVTEAEEAVRAARPSANDAPTPHITIRPGTPTPAAPSRQSRTGAPAPAMKFDETTLPHTHSPATNASPQTAGALPRRADRTTQPPPAVIPRLAPKSATSSAALTSAGLPRRGALADTFAAAGTDVIRRFPQVSEPAVGDDAERRASMLKSFTRGVDAGRDDQHTDGDAS